MSALREPNLSLLEALPSAARGEGRGRLKVFLGAAPGVGKTYAMLEAAQARRAEGVDLVVGVVETHDRPEAEVLLEGLEVIPRRCIDYQGRTFEEMDLDAILARRPALALVDELAHSNVPGSRHPKRYQDVEELLEAGIHVYTTVNIQHLESLTDIVTRITGVQVRETLPDRVLGEANEIQLIDLSCEELLQRLREGKVYVPEPAGRTMEHFFRPGNLAALRELTLHHAAERVDGQLLDYMRAHAIPGPWPARERLMVCVGDGPTGVRLVRVAHRAAERRQLPWLAVHVRTSRHHRLPKTVKTDIHAALRLAEQLGGEALTVHGKQVAEEILTCARSRNVSQIVIGRPRGPRWLRCWRRSVGDQLLESSTGFDVLMVAGEDAPTSVPAPGRSRASWPDYVKAATATAGAGLLAYAVSTVLPLPNLSLIFVMAVLWAAIRLGLWPSIFATGLSFLIYNFFFTVPHHTFTIAHTEDILTILFFLLIAVTISHLAARFRNQVEATRVSARRTANLYDFGRKVADVIDLNDVLWVVVHHVIGTLRCKAMVLLPRDGRLAIAAVWPPRDRLEPAAAAAADWAWNHSKPAGHGSDTLPASPWLFIPLQSARGAVGVLGVEFEEPGGTLDPEEWRLLEALADQAALAIERTALAADIEKAHVLTETERLRSALLSSLSHDLRTPLASIIGATSSLISYGDGFDRNTRLELLHTVEDEAERLNRFVQNLLDMTRLGSGALTPRRDWVDLQDLIDSARKRLQRGLQDRRLSVQLAPDLPLLYADFTLLEQVFINILDNACKYSPAGGEVTLRACRDGERLRLEFLDQGPGIPEAEQEQVFDMFYRVKATDSRAAGTGLGLSICRGIVAAHDGTIQALTGEGGHGARILVTLPLREASAPTAAADA